MSLTHITHCLLCPPERPKKIIADQIPQVNPGEAPPEAVGRFVQTLSDHLQKKHPEAFQHAVAMAQVMMAHLIVCRFETTDPRVSRARDETRAFLHKLTRKNDEAELDLRMRLEAFGFDPSDNQHGLLMLKDLRDFLLEEGEYAPTSEPQTIVTA
jgi:hypothetical protein